MSYGCALRVGDSMGDQMIRRTTWVLAAVCLLVSTGMAAAEPALAVSDVNMRGGPGTNFPVMMLIPGGTTVDVRGCSGEWCQVTFAGRLGFANASYLDFGDGPPVPVPGPGFPAGVYPGPVPPGAIYQEPDVDPEPYYAPGPGPYGPGPYGPYGPRGPGIYVAPGGPGPRYDRREIYRGPPQNNGPVNSNPKFGNNGPGPKVGGPPPQPKVQMAPAAIGKPQARGGPPPQSGAGQPKGPLKEDPANQKGEK
jgi:hypothetical protein